MVDLQFQAVHVERHLGAYADTSCTGEANFSVVDELLHFI